MFKPKHTHIPKRRRSADIHLVKVDEHCPSFFQSTTPFLTVLFWSILKQCQKIVEYEIDIFFMPLLVLSCFAYFFPDYASVALTCMLSIYWRSAWQAIARATRVSKKLKSCARPVPKLVGGADDFELKQSTYDKTIEYGNVTSVPSIHKLAQKEKLHSLYPFVHSVIGEEIANEWSVLHTVGNGMCGFNAFAFACNDVP